MSNKAKIKAAQKRAGRRVASKQKGPRKPYRSTIETKVPTALEQALQRNNLDNPFDKVKDGSLPGEVLSTEEMIKKSRESVTSLFRMFSYIAMAKQLAEKQQIEYTPVIDVDDAALRLVQLDRRVINLPALSEGEEEVFAFELMDIGAEFDNLATRLYSEVEYIEPHALVMEAHLDSAAKDVLADPEFNISTQEAATAMVLESMAFIHVGKHINVKG